MITMNNANTRNIAREIANTSGRKALQEAFDEDKLQIIVTDDGYFDIWKCDSDSLRNLAIKETKRVHPEYTYVGKPVEDKETE